MDAEQMKQLDAALCAAEAKCREAKRLRSIAQKESAQAPAQVPAPAPALAPMASSMSEEDRMRYKLPTITLEDGRRFKRFQEARKRRILQGDPNSWPTPDEYLHDPQP